MQNDYGRSWFVLHCMFCILHCRGARDRVKSKEVTMKRFPLLLTLLSATCLAADAPRTAPSTRPTGTPISLPATVEAYEQVDLYAQVSGYLKAVNYDIGDQVEAGKDLAVIDQPELVA